MITYDNQDTGVSKTTQITVTKNFHLKFIEEIVSANLLKSEWGVAKSENEEPE